MVRHPTSIFTASLLSLFEGGRSQRSSYMKVRGSKKQPCSIIISEVLCSGTTHKVMASPAASMGTLFPLFGENQIFRLARSRRPETITQAPFKFSHRHSRQMIRKSQGAAVPLGLVPYKVKCIKGLMQTERVAPIAFLVWHAGLPIFNAQTKQVLNLNTRVLNLSVQFTFGCLIPNCIIHFLVEFKARHRR